MIHLKHKILFFALAIHSIPAMALGPFEYVCSHPDINGQVVQTAQRTSRMPSEFDRFLGGCAKNSKCFDGLCVGCITNGKGQINPRSCKPVAAIGPQGHSGSSKGSKSKAGKANPKNMKCPDPLRGCKAS